MYILHRLNKLGCPKSEMIEVLKQQILSMAEQAVPFWGPSITKEESRMIEGILKRVVNGRQMDTVSVL